ncbi:MAG: type II toxin-antitoxin system HicA family toxin [bacterium]
MSKLSPIPARKVLKKLKRVGFIKIHQRGSHLTLKNEKDNRFVTIPMHSGDIPVGTLYNIVVNQAGLFIADFNEL